jgi:DNA-binding NtrC family response regulator
LIVDDEKEFVDGLLKRLRRRGIACQGVYCGTDALAMIAFGEFDTVLLDMLLPDQNGGEVLRRIKVLRPETRVIMLTGHASVDAGRESICYGAADYLIKPVELETLYEKLTAGTVGSAERSNKGSPSRKNSRDETVLITSHYGG